MKKEKVLFWLILLALLVCELLLAWKVPGFSDFYVKKIFPLWNMSYCRLFGLFKISIGEFLIYGGVVYVVLTILLWLIRFVKLMEKKDILKRLTRANSKVFFKLIIFIGLLQVQNCFVLYHTTPMFVGTEAEAYEPTREDLIDFRETLVKRANELSKNFERNSKGEILYDADLKSIAMITMQDLGEKAVKRTEEGHPEILDDKLSMLKGYYSNPKPFYKSDFFCQQSICGYYFPFTLEANYNDLMYITNLPCTLCHELSHLKGFIFEDEASFLAYLGCMNSKDMLFTYSATLEAFAYVDVELKRNLALEPEIRNSLTPIDPLVTFDSMFITKETKEMVEADAWFKTEKVEKASDTFIDTNLTVNGVEDGIVSYSRMVNLLLKYYYGNGV